MLETGAWDGWQRLSAKVLEQVAEDDPAALAQLLDHLAWIESQLPEVVAKLRQPTAGDTEHGTPGYSWAGIAEALGISRQAAHKRFHRAGA